MSGLSDKELARRIGKVTGSTGAGLLARSPYAKPSEWWRWQMGLAKPKPSLPMLLGSIYEDAIVQASLLLLSRGQGHHQQASTEYGRFEKPTSTYLVGHEDWLVVHPDGVLWDAKEMIQAKRHDGFTRGKYGHPGQAGEADNDIVPVHELIQCQLELAAWSSQRGDEAREWRVCWLCVDFGEANGPRLYRIVKNPALIRVLVKALQDFWQKHMQKDNPVEPSNTDWQLWIDDAMEEPSRSQSAQNYRVPLTRADINASPVVEW